MRQKTCVHTVHCPLSQTQEWVELALSTVPEFQLCLPKAVSCTLREDAAPCGQCVDKPE